MKKNYIIKIFLISAIFFASAAQVSNFYNAQKIIYYSEIVADSFYIYISLPNSYNNSDRSYPVLYTLDGDIVFGIAAGITRYLQIGDNIPELIVVGIGYGTIDKSAGEKRRRDYRPVRAGGAENFLKYLNDELIPFVDSKYRTIPDERTIYGFSIGGLFAFYTLFTKPETFNKYIIGSPILTWDNYSIFDYEELATDKLKERKLNIFISVGSEESEEKFFNPIDRMVTTLQQREYQGINIETKVFGGSSHLMGPPESLTHGLLSVFGKR